MPGAVQSCSTGDIYPVTHFGGTVSALAALGGVVLLSLLTANFIKAITWSTFESKT